MRLTQDNEGKQSTKRWLTWAAFLLLASAFLADLIGEVSIDPSLVTTMQTVVLVGIGSVAAEKFAPKR